MDLVRDDKSLKKYVFAVYILQALAFIGLLFMPIIGVMINYIKGDDVRGSWLESHFSWQKRTFWYGLLWSVLGYLTYMIIGWLVLFIVPFWYFYRIAKGWIYLVDGKQMYAD